MSTLFNVKIRYTNILELEPLLAPYPGANKSDFFTGQTIIVGAEGIVFQDDFTRQKFIEKYKEKYEAIKTNEAMGFNMGHDY